MAKILENPILSPTQISTHKRFRSPVPATICKCGCKCSIDTCSDSYIIIDGDLFLDDGCVTDYFIKEAGGRRVYGGAC